MTTNRRCEGSEEMVALYRQLKERNPHHAKLVLEFIRGLVQPSENFFHKMQERD